MGTSTFYYLSPLYGLSYCPIHVAYNHCLVWFDFVIEGYVYMVTLQYKQAAYIAIQLLYFTNMEIKLICQQHICKKFILQSRNNIIFIYGIFTRMRHGK